MASHKVRALRAVMAIALAMGSTTADGGAAAAAAAAGASVTLAWDAPSGGALSYVIEAGSAPGLADLAALDTGSPDTVFHLDGVPDGTYFVRVRARNVTGVGDASDEIVIQVHQGVVSLASGPCSAPLPPTGLTATVNGAAIALRWQESQGAQSYQLEAGSAPGANDLFNGDIGNLRALEAVVAPGRYSVRVRARNNCGVSAPSIELMIQVRASP